MTLLTEEEAKAAICPLIQVLKNERDVLVFRSPGHYEHQNCQASDCKLGWRWGSAGKEGGVGYCGAFGPPTLGPVPVAGAVAIEGADGDAP